MSVILARIDDRLIHGQVTEGWCPKLRPDTIIVVSDNIAKSDWQRDICLACLPRVLCGKVISTKDAPEMINTFNTTSETAYILFESPRDAYSVIENGAQISSLNVGGMHASSGKQEILDYIHVDDEDKKYLRELSRMGVELDFRDLPNHENVDVLARLK